MNVNEANVCMLGEERSGFRIQGKVQNYEELKNRQLRKKVLFKDKNFCANSMVIANSDKRKGKVEWKRPKDIVTDPQFIVGEANRFDINQGKLQDCWFVSALACVTTNPTLLSHLVPEQNFTEDYVGIFHFRFWQYGCWVDVVIDDRLPTIDNKLIYLVPSTNNEFWAPLFHKAYAKLCGSYANLEGGQISEALEDMCGGLSEWHYANQDLSDIIAMANQTALMGCSIVPRSLEIKKLNGLIVGHAYSVIDTTPLEVENNQVILIKLRNPWGEASEWRGDWSSISDCWNLLPQETRIELQANTPHGEFWMQLEDFQKIFSFLDICHLTPSSFVGELANPIGWNYEELEGAWIPNITAGGGINYLDTFGSNFQYQLQILENNLNGNYVVISLMQKDRRFYGEAKLTLELNIYEVINGTGRVLDVAFFRENVPLIHVNNNEGMRQLTIRTQFPMGNYCIIPSTTEPNIFGTFFLRIYSQTNLSADNLRHILPEDIENDRIDTILEDLYQNVSVINWSVLQKELERQHQHPGVIEWISSFFHPKYFSDETCKALVNLEGVSVPSYLNREECKKLLIELARLEATFTRYHKDLNKQLTETEFRMLLIEVGCRIDRKKFHEKFEEYSTNNKISFENFVVCAFRLKAEIE